MGNIQNKLPAVVNPDGYTLEQGLASVGKGWEILIRVAFRFKPDSVKIVQVKEKFAGLRIYTHFVEEDEDFESLLNILEHQSYRMCEWCGKEGTLDNRYYWLLTLCEQCKRKRKREKQKVWVG